MYRLNSEYTVVSIQIRAFKMQKKEIIAANISKRCVNSTILFHLLPDGKNYEPSLGNIT